MTTKITNRRSGHQKISFTEEFLRRMQSDILSHIMDTREKYAKKVYYVAKDELAKRERETLEYLDARQK